MCLISLSHFACLLLHGRSRRYAIGAVAVRAWNSRPLETALQPLQLTFDFVAPRSLPRLSAAAPKGTLLPCRTRQSHVL